MSLFGPKNISLNETELEKNELFVHKKVPKPRKSIAVVPRTHNAIIIKEGVYSNVLPMGNHAVVEKGERSLYVELIFVSKTCKVEVKWGTSNKFNMRDSQDNAVKLGVRGVFEVKVVDPRKAYNEFLDTENLFNLESMQSRLRVRICNEIQPIIAKVTEDLGLTLTELPDNSAQLAEEIKPIMDEMLRRDYGLALDTFNIDAIVAETEEAGN